MQTEQSQINREIPSSWRSHHKVSSLEHASPNPLLSQSPSTWIRLAPPCPGLPLFRLIRSSVLRHREGLAKWGQEGPGPNMISSLRSLPFPPFLREPDRGRD